MSGEGMRDTRIKRCLTGCPRAPFCDDTNRALQNGWCGRRDSWCKGDYAYAFASLCRIFLRFNGDSRGSHGISLEGVDRQCTVFFGNLHEPRSNTCFGFLRTVSSVLRELRFSVVESKGPQCLLRRPSYLKTCALLNCRVLLLVLLVRGHVPAGCRSGAKSFEAFPVCVLLYITCRLRQGPGPTAGYRQGTQEATTILPIFKAILL